jgi:hypothetical protein
VTFEITQDLALVREVMTHPRVWPWITDDGSPAVEDFRPVNGPNVLYLLCLDGEALLGLWMFVERNSVSLEVHTCLLPGHGFHRARNAARQAAEWIWEHTGCQRIVTHVPVTHRIARRFAEASGMTEFGRDPQSISRSGSLCDQILLGISRPKERTCQQQ